MGPVQIVQGNQHTLGDAITNLMTTLQGKKDKQDAQNEQQARILAQQFVTLPADVQAANFQSLPEAAQKYVLNRTGYAPHKDTAEEALNTRRAQEGLKGWDDPASLGPGGINAARYQAATDKAAPTELTQANVANAVYNNDPKLGLAPQMQARQGIADKSVMEAKDAAANTLAVDKFNQVEKPKNVAEIGHLGAQTAEQYAAAGNQKAQAGYHGAQTGLTNAKTQALVSGGIDPETGRASPAVQNLVNAAVAASAAGADPTKLVKAIRDKGVGQAVQNALAKDHPEVLAYMSLSPKDRDDLAKLKPLLGSVDEIIKRYEPMKGENGLFDRNTFDALGYKLGVAPGKDSPLNGLVAKMQMLGVQGGSRLLSGGSRAYPALKMAMEHTPNPMKDTHEQIYDKAVQMKSQLQAAANAILNVGTPGSPAQTSQRFNDTAPQGGGKTVSAAELKAMGSNPQEAAANGYTVVP